MRRLLPDVAADVDLDAEYAWPDGARQVVRANMVSSADGAGSHDGVTDPISGPADKRVFAVLRGLCDVILVGAGTARQERYGGTRPGPERLAIRQAAGLPPVPPIAVVSNRLDLDPAGPLFPDTLIRPIVVTAEAAPADRRAALGRVADIVLAGADRVEIAPMLDGLCARGYRHVLCEGGPQLLGAVLTAGRLDELCLTVSPCLTAGAASRIVTGPEFPAPTRLTVQHLLTEDGALFLRYAVGYSSPVADSLSADSSPAVPSPPESP